MEIVSEFSITDTVIMGKKGEILPKKKIREKLDLSPGDKLYIGVIDGGMIIKKIPSVEDLFNAPKIASGTPQYFKEMARNEIKKQLDLNK